MANLALNLLSKSIGQYRGIIALEPPATIIIRGDGSNNYCCGNCGTVIIEKLDTLANYSNTAGICNRCKSINDFAVRPFRDKPITLNDTQINRGLNLSLETFPIWLNKSFTGVLSALSDQLREDFTINQIGIPNVLQHYTSYHGMAGIIGSNKLWLTDIAYMNDASELSHGKNLIENYLEEVAKDASPPFRELIERSKIPTASDDTSMGYYATSFCRNNDLLSQWRAYGAGGSGYALGFSTHHIPLSDKLQLRKVIYNPDLQLQLVKNTVDRTIEVFKQIIGEKSIETLDKEVVLPAFAGFLSQHLIEYIFTFKHNSFEEENEVRLIYKFRRDQDLLALKFRHYNSVPVPYMELSLTTDAKHLPLMPIVTITHGPTLQPELTRKSLSLLLENNNYGHVEILGSKTPLRL